MGTLQEKWWDSRAAGVNHFDLKVLYQKDGDVNGGVMVQVNGELVGLGGTLAR
jgi:hypothetical protein